jgi:hypothetical protein
MGGAGGVDDDGGPSGARVDHGDPATLLARHEAVSVGRETMPRGRGPTSMVAMSFAGTTSMAAIWADLAGHVEHFAVRRNDAPPGSSPTRCGRRLIRSGRSTIDASPVSC